MNPGQGYRFGPFRLDAGSRQLWKGAEQIHLTPKVFDTLQYLVSNPGRLLPKEEFLKAVWPDRFVDEANLTQSLSVLRRALGESESGTKYIATFHGRGYQFLLPVEVENPVADPLVLTATPRTGLRKLWIALALGAVCLAAAWFSYRGQSTRPEVFRSERRRPLTRLPGNEYQPAFSRDGTKIAFVWDRGDGQGAAIFVKGPEDDEPRPVSQATSVAAGPAWSPDGRYLAYLCYRGSDMVLAVTPERGGSERKVLRVFPTRYGLNYRHLDWSPNGKQLAIDDKDSAADPFSIFLVDLEIGSRKRFSRQDQSIIGDVDPRFSPDGSSVSFVRMIDRFQHELFSQDLADGKLQQWTADRKQIGGHDWSPDGKAMYLSSNRDGEFGVSKTNDARGRGLASLSSTGIVSVNPIQLSVSRSGSRLAYSEFGEDLNIWRLQLDSKGTAGPQWSRIVASTGEDILPQLSPDGTRICFLSDRSGEEHLWVAAADGSDPHQLTRGKIRPVAGRWSPDGKQIVFNEASAQTMFEIQANGGVPTILGGSPMQGVHPMYAPDGRGIFFNGSAKLMYMSSHGAVAKVLLSRRVHQKIATPDGRDIYFTGGRTDPMIWRYTVSSGAVERILDGLLPGYWGAWALAGKGIYYLAADETSPARAVIRFHDFGSGQSKIIAPFPGTLPPIGTSTWALTPDEQYLYVVRVNVSMSDLNLIEGPVTGR